MKNKTLTVAALVLAALLSTTAFAQKRGGMGGGGGFRTAPTKSYSPRTYSPPAKTYSPPAQTYTPPVTRPSGTGGGMGTSGKFQGTINSTTSPSTTGKSGMGASGNFKSPSTGTTSTTTTQRSPMTTTPRSGATTSTTHVYNIGSRPPATVHYSSTVIVGGRTRYIYPDGSYSFDPTGVIIGYMALQNAQNAQNAYQQGVNDANYNNQVAQGYVPTAPRTVVVQQGPGAGVIFLWVVIGVIVVIAVLALAAKYSG